MSYNVVMVRTEVKDRCKKENLDIGWILENEPDSLKPFSPEDIDLIKEWLLSSECDFKIEREQNGVLDFVHLSQASIQATLRKGHLFFSSGSSRKSEVLHATMIIMEMSAYDIMRFDFQDGRWG